MNICVFSGRTTKDIELRYTQDHMAIGTFTLAVDSGYGENKKTSFFDCTAFKGTAESMEKYVRKGSKIIIQAEARQNVYEDRDGKKRSSVNFIVNNWEFAESKSSSAPAAAPQANTDQFMSIPDGLDELPFN